MKHRYYCNAIRLGIFLIYKQSYTSLALAYQCRTKTKTMQTQTFTIERGEALMQFFKEYDAKREQLPLRMHELKEPILELIDAGISAASAFDIVLDGDNYHSRAMLKNSTLG